MDCWHLTLAADDRRNAFATAGLRLAAVRSLVRVAGARALLWCVVDDHVHLVVEGTRSEAGRLGQRVQLTLAAVVPRVRFQGTHFAAVRERRHLYTLVPYVLTQSQHHGLGGAPALWEGSCCADLLGARVLQGFDAELLWGALPRLTPRDIAVAAGLAGQIEVDPAVLHEASPRELLRAAAAAIGRTDLLGRDPAVVAARAALARAGAEQGWSSAQMTDLLAVHPSSARRLARSPATRVDGALRRQLALRNLAVAVRTDRAA